MEFKGMLSSVDFEENEITIKVEGEIKIKYGKYVVIDSEKFQSIETTKNNLLEVLQSFVRDFEGDYMLNDEIFDNPNNLLLTNYECAKEAIEKALKID